MKRLLALVLTFSMVFSMAFAYPKQVKASDNNLFESRDNSWGDCVIDARGIMTLNLKNNLPDTLPWEAYVSSIKMATVTGSNVTSLSGLFCNCTSLSSANLDGLDTSLVTDFSYCFYGCTSLSISNFSKLNMASATSLEGMFEGCSTLTFVDLSGWTFGKSGLSLEGMFADCSALTELDLSSWVNTSKVASLKSAFLRCTSLSYINFTNFDTSGVEDWSYAFAGDTKLSTKIDIKNNTGSYADAFNSAATASGAAVVLRYDGDTYENLVTNLLASKQNSKSNVTAWAVAEITEDCISLSESKYIYDGTAKEPEVTVTVNSVTLKKDTDYTVVYSNNVQASSAAMVTVTGQGDYKGSVNIYFSINLEENTITVEAEAFNRVKSNKKQTFTFTATGLYTVPTVKSSNSKVKASISRKGKVTVTIAAKFMGEAILTLSTESGEAYAASTKKVVVTVGPKSTKLKSVSPTTKGGIKVKWSKGSQINGYQIRCSLNSDMSSAISKNINKKGTLSATINNLNNSATYYVQVRTYKKVGSSKVYSSWSSAKTVTTVGLSLSADSKTIYKGSTAKLKVIGTGKTIKWTSSDKSVASVNKKGKITAKKTGSCTITAKVGDTSLECAVTVSEKSGYDKLYEFINKNGSTNKSGYKKISNGNAYILYDSTYNRFKFVYLEKTTAGTQAVEMAMPRDGSTTMYVTYTYVKDTDNCCQGTANFLASEYSASSSLSFNMTVAKGSNTAEYNTMANSLFQKAMKGWKGIVKEAKTSMSKIGFESY